MFEIVEKLLKHENRHRNPNEVSKRARRRLYTSLLYVQEEERYAMELLNLPIRPRLSVIDEELVVMIKPIDRKDIRMDEQMHKAREEKMKKMDQNESE